MGRDTHPYSQALGEHHPASWGEPYSFAGLHSKLGFWDMKSSAGVRQGHGELPCVAGWREMPCFGQEWESVQDSPCFAASAEEVNFVFPFMPLVLQVLD